MDDEIVPMEELKRIIVSILENGFPMSLGTVDEMGVWVTNVTYVHDADYNLYWLSRVDSRHSEAILKNPNVAATITLSDNPNREVIGLQISGRRFDDLGVLQASAAFESIQPWAGKHPSLG